MVKSPELRLVPTGSLHPDPGNPRRDETPDDELVASIAESGVLQSLLVRTADDGYTVIAGHRRLKAATLAKVKAVPCIVMDGLTEEQIAAVQLAENMHRRHLNPIEQAEALDRIRQMSNAPQRVIATMTGITQGQVSKLLRLLTLPDDVKAKIERFEITVDAALGYGRATGKPRTMGTRQTVDPAFDRLQRVIADLAKAIILKDRKARRLRATEAIEILSRWAPLAVVESGGPVAGDDDFDDEAPIEDDAPSVKCVFCDERLTVEAPGDVTDRGRARARHYAVSERCRNESAREARQLARS